MVDIEKADIKAHKVAASTGHDLKGHGWWENSYQQIWSMRDVAFDLLLGREVELVCRYCQERLEIDISSSSIHVLNDPCENEYGVGKEYSVRIEIPSGKIIFANDLRQFFVPKDERPHFDVNAYLGQREATEYYAKFGMAHGYVGNSTPGVFKDGTHVRIVQLDHDTEEPEYIDEFGDYLGSIDTYLWWYSLADHDLLKYHRIDSRDVEYGVADVEPGVYELTHYPWAGIDEEPPFVYAEMRLSE